MRKASELKRLKQRGKTGRKQTQSGEAEMDRRAHTGWGGPTDALGAIEDPASRKQGPNGNVILKRHSKNKKALLKIKIKSEIKSAQNDSKIKLKKSTTMREQDSDTGSTCEWA